jgi:hypothetical protein
MEPALERQKNQQEFRELLERLGITQAQAADLITKDTLRHVSARTVKSWLAAPTAKSARSCPVWAIKVLKKLENENNLDKGTLCP